jgi:hypothetical protein
MSTLPVDRGSGLWNILRQIGLRVIGYKIRIHPILLWHYDIPPTSEK